MKKYTAAVIGCGRVGVQMEGDPGKPKPATHTGAFIKSSRIKLVGAAEVDLTTRRRAQKFMPGMPIFSNADELLKKTKPDIVAIATPDKTHWPMVRVAAKYNPKLIIDEKPIADNISDAKKIISLCKKKGIVLLINYMRRFDPVLHKLGEKIRGGELGKIQQARCLYVNGLRNSGSHAIDLLRWYLGEVKWVQGWKNPYAAFSHKGDGNVDAILMMKNGTRVILQSLNIKNYSIFEIEFYGTRKATMIRNMGFTIDVVPLRKSHHYTGFQELDIAKIKRHTDEKRSFFSAMAKHAVACLDGREKPASTGYDALRALEIIDAIRKSATRGGSQITL